MIWLPSLGVLKLWPLWHGFNVQSRNQGPDNGSPNGLLSFCHQPLQNTWVMAAVSSRGQGIGRAATSSARDLTGLNQMVARGLGAVSQPPGLPGPWGERQASELDLPAAQAWLFRPPDKNGRRIEPPHQGDDSPYLFFPQPDKLQPHTKTARLPGTAAGRPQRSQRSSSPGGT